MAAESNIIMKHILITGAAGFVASHLAEKLIIEGHNVIGVDNFITGLASNIKRLENTAQESDGSFSFIEANIAGSNVIETIQNSVDTVDQIYQLACPASPKDFAELGKEILEVCSLGNKHMLEIALHFNARYVFCSTSEVYGDPIKTPQTEKCLGNVNVLGPRSCYDEGKRFAESYIINFCKRNQVDYRITRIFNTYGEYMRKDDGRVIPNFIEQLHNNEPITIYGTGNQTRSFCYIADMCEGLTKLMNYDGFTHIHEEEPEERVFNLGNPEEVTIIELAETLAKLMSKELNTIALDLPQDDPKRRCPDISKAQKLLNFKPQYKLYDGLKETLSKW